MAQANLPVLPQISAALAAPPAKPRAAADTAGDDQAFAKALDKHLKPQESARPEQAAKPAQGAKPAEGGKKAEGGNAAEGGKTAENRADPASPAEAALKTAALRGKPDAVLPFPPADGLGQVSPSAEEAEVAAADLPSDPASAAEDPLQASLAGLPAALAALLAGNPSTPPPADPALAAAAVDPALGTPAGAAPGTDAIAATLARMLAETASGRAETPAAPALPDELAQGAPLEGEALSQGPTTPLAGEDAEAFAAALGEATGRKDRAPVLPAVATESGPASRASETAQLAANPAAGDAAARPETNPAAALAWAHAPGRIHHEDGGPRLVVPQPPDHPAWAETVGSKVTWLVGQGESSAELVLTPPQLGRVEVSLSVSGDQTTAQFVAATPAAREALEQALPRLREVLAEAGIQLAQSGVSTSDQQGDRGEGSRQGHRRHEGGGVPGGELEIGARPWQRRGEGLVDTFA